MMTPGRAEPDLTTYAGRFGARIRAIREKKGLTQQEVADAVGVNQVTLAGWESGKRFPNAEYIPCLANALKQKHVCTLFPD